MIDPFSPPPQADQQAFRQWEKAGRQAVMRHDPEMRTAAAGPVFKSFSLSPQPDSARTGMGSALSEERSRPSSGDDGYSFGDVVDIFNPLQHLPVVGTFYRKYTGDTIKPFASIVGSALFGGPIGAVASTVNALVKDRTGRDVAENAFAAMGYDATPSRSAKPDITYGAPLDPGGVEILEPQAFAAASRAYTASGQRNFAAAARSAADRWNS